MSNVFGEKGMLLSLREYFKVINPQIESGQKTCLYLLKAFSHAYWLRRDVRDRKGHTTDSLQV